MVEKVVNKQKIKIKNKLIMINSKIKKIFFRFKFILISSENIFLLYQNENIYYCTERYVNDNF